MSLVTPSITGALTITETGHFNDALGCARFSFPVISTSFLRNCPQTKVVNARAKQSEGWLKNEKEASLHQAKDAETMPLVAGSLVVSKPTCCASGIV
jgi:hypothetical protein